MHRFSSIPVPYNILLYKKISVGKMGAKCAVLIFSILFFCSSLSEAQVNQNESEVSSGGDHVESCQCMEYWECTVRLKEFLFKFQIEIIYNSI